MGGSRISPIFPIRVKRVVLREPEILRICAGKKVLHLGCSNVPFTLQLGEDLLHKQLAKVTKPDLLWGLESGEEGVRLLREMGFDHIIHGNAERLPPYLREERFDIVLAGEIIEHVPNPGRLLQSIRSIMTENTEVLLTTINAFAFRGFLLTMLRKEKVHEDHNCYFSYQTLKQLFRQCGLKCTDIYYYIVLNNLLDKALYLTTWISPVWSDGLIVRATRG